jgi:hypothetical protein
MSPAASVSNAINSVSDPGAAFSMDTSPGNSFISIIFWFNILTAFLDAKNAPSKASRPCTVRLPYSSIPGMDYSSRVYIKALATLGKQVHANDHQLLTCSKLSSNKDSMDLGKLIYFFSFYLWLNIFKDNPIASVSKTDIETIKRARDTITNDVIIDITDENPGSDQLFRNSLRHQIVEDCTRLRINLLSIDHLMDLFNKSISKGPSTSA